jgi:hypothetical protein
MEGGLLLAGRGSTGGMAGFDGRAVFASPPYYEGANRWDRELDFEDC